MKAGIHSWWLLVSAAASATLIDVGWKRLGLLLIEVFCAVAALHAYRAPQGKRWAAVRNQWMPEIRDVFIVVFSVGAGVFGYELMWKHADQGLPRQLEVSFSNPSALFNRGPTVFPLGATNVFPSNGRRPICVQVLLPQGFKGGSYKLPYKPVAPSPPVLYDNGSAQRRGL
jgi:hypothetical protein